MKRFLLLLAFLPLHREAAAHPYRFGPGFNARECSDLLRIHDAFFDTAMTNGFRDFLPFHRFLHRTPSIGLDNLADIWLRDDSTVVITLRGTTSDSRSILADFYCAMLPAKGYLVHPDRDTFYYQLAADPRAAVHGGFLIGFTYLARDIYPRMDSLYRAGYHNYIIAGHSQGGALCYYMSAWMWYLQQNGRFPEMKVKTYASASPKMGNMYFAYDYDNVTRSEWTYSIVNSMDIVPETPFTTQQLETDMGRPNPFADPKKTFRKLPALKRMALISAFNRMRRHAGKSARAYRKYLGDYTGGMIRKVLPGIHLPEAVNSTYFVRPGVPVVFTPTGAYYKALEPVANGPYYHHAPASYRYLLNIYYGRELGQDTGRTDTE